jgi:hypothetical protein
MALAWSIVVGVVLSLLLGGSLQRIADVRLRGLWLVFVAFALQVIAFPFHWLPWTTSDQAGKVLWLVSYGVIALVAAANFRVAGIPVIAAGFACNLLAVTSNAGHMPALPSALRGAGLHFTVNRNSARLEHPHLAWLVDRWAVPSWIPGGNVFSVGDVLICLGGITFVLVATGALRMRRSGGSARPAPSTR